MTEGEKKGPLRFILRFLKRVFDLEFGTAEGTMNWASLVVAGALAVVVMFREGAENVVTLVAQLIAGQEIGVSGKGAMELFWACMLWAFLCMAILVVVDMIRTRSE